MKHFKPIDNLPVYDLMPDYLTLLKSDKINWGNRNQINITSVKGKEDDIHYGGGSLYYDWDKSYWCDKENRLIVPPRDVMLRDEDFTELATPFRGTMFEDVYNTLCQQYVLGRTRLMLSQPKTCLSWHVDFTPRLHYPIKTQEGCLMIIDDEMCHLEQNKWWCTNTLTNHTALNSSKEDRIHIVAVILAEK